MTDDGAVGLAPAADHQPVDEDESPEDENAETAASGAARGTALNVVGSVFGAITGFITVGLITNLWGRSGAGLFFAATALFTLAANGARLGAESGLSYFVARLRADGNDSAVPSVVRSALAATGSVATVLAVCGIVAAPMLGGLVTNEAASRPDAEAMIRVLALGVPTFALTQAMLGASRGFATMRPSVVVSQIIRPLSQVVLVVVVVIVTDSLWALAVAWAVSSAVSMVSIGLWLQRRLARVSFRHPQTVGGGDERRHYARFATPRALADLVSATLDRIDVILVAILLGEAAAGLYGASNRLILAGQLMMIATAQATAPLLTASFATGRNGEAQRILRTVTAWNITMLWPVFICLAIGARTALSVFGAGFGQAWPMVVVLAVALLAIIGMGGGDTLLTTTGDSKASLANHVVALAIMLVAALTLLPAFGVVGAAWTWALSRITLRALAGRRIWQTRRIHVFGPPVLIAGSAAVVAYGPVGILLLVVLGPGWTTVVANVGVGALVHLALLARYRHALELDQLAAVITGRAPGRTPAAR